MKYLYHGTSSKRLPDIMERGILPRSALGEDGHWIHSVTSNAEAVYLSIAYAPYFAGVAADADGSNPVVLEIDVEELDMNFLLADEDALEQGTRKLGKNHPLYCDLKGMKARTMWYRENSRRLAKAHPNLWQTSILLLGTCCYYGGVPDHCITEKVEFESSCEITLTWGDPTVSIQNFHILGTRYINRTAALFERDLEDLIPEGYESSPLV